MAATASPGVENYVNGLNTSTSGDLRESAEPRLLSAQSGFTNCNAPITHRSRLSSEGRSDERAVPVRDQDHELQLPPQGMGPLQRAGAAHQPESGPFSLLGTTYGGDGRTNFALPNLQGRTPIHRSSAYPLGQAGGEQKHTLTVSEMPPHTHALQAPPGAGTQAGGGNAVLATGLGQPLRPAGEPEMNAGAVGPTGAEPYSNMQPYLTLSFCIALVGIYPSRD